MTIRTTLITLAGLSSVFLLVGCTQSDSPQNPVAQEAKGVPQIVFNETEFDFGVIKQSGGKVKHEFTFVYNGKEPLKITGVPTSCACASASVDKTQFMNGDTGVLRLEFNPNLHEEPDGRFFKTIVLLTDPPLETTPEVKMWAEIDLDLGPEAFELKEDHNDEEEHEAEQEYHSITPEQLSSVLEKENVVLVDVHIPEQEHLPDTDLFIPYNEIGDNLHQLPTDKNTPIVLYCRSGGMSRAAAYVLSEHGYTNIYDLVGGKNAYDAWSEEQGGDPSVFIHSDRITKKPFGMYITPEDSPVQPERFSGYHTGADFEVLPGENEKTISFSAICDGKAIFKDRVNGYGGVFVQQCSLDSTQVTVLYGHISIASISFVVGDVLRKGDPIGYLGSSFSEETGGERAHLHLGIHKGDTVDFRGYVAEKTLLVQWIDPVHFLDIS